MKQLAPIFLLLLTSLSLTAQEAKRSLLYDFILDKEQHGIGFAPTKLFDADKNELVSGNGIVAHFTSLTLDKPAVSNIFNKKPAGIKLSVPGGRQKNFELVLAAEQINSSNDFYFGTITNNVKQKTSSDQGLHYRGYIAGDSSSLACISIFNNGEIMGVFANRDGNFIIGRMKNTTDRYVVYNSSDMMIQPRYKCAANELKYPLSVPGGHDKLPGNIASAPPPPVLCKKVRLYWESDYQLYSYNFKSNLTNTQNYLAGLFNVVATIYQNEGIIVELSKSYVWTSADPYSSGSSNLGLDSFTAYWNNLGDTYDGDLAHLIAGGTTNNGGISYILDFDQCNRPYTYGYSNVYASFQAYPNYSWDAQVVTHETGHNLGSNHTHWCGWNTGAGGTCGAIDNCYALESGSGCTTCPSTTNISSPPAGFKGTIMSYCYLINGIGVSFVNGFGPLPQAVIRNNVSSATCFTTRNIWTGTVNNAWETPANWSCGSIPDVGTDVIINEGPVNYPTISSMATCRSIKEGTGASIKINSNFRLTIAGKSR